MRSRIFTRVGPIGAAAALIAAAGISAPTVATASPSLTQAIIASGPGCGNSITASAVNYDGKVQGKRLLVRARPGFQLISRDLNTKPMVLLYSAYDCTAKTHQVFTQPLAPGGSSSLILQTTPDQWLVDAAWDAKNKAPSVLLREGDTYSIQTNRGGGWVPVWVGSRNQLGYSLNGMRGATGGEYKVFGNGHAAGWATFRIGETGFTNIELSGPGRLNDIAGTVLEQASAYMTSSGTYICDSLTSGDVVAATASGQCVSVPSATAAHGAFVSASSRGNSYRLIMNNSDLGPSLQAVVTCQGGTLFSCGRPSSTSASATTYFGLHLIYMPLFDVNFKRLGSKA